MQASDFDNFPQSDRKEEIEKISLDRLRDFLHTEHFCVREDLPDKGIDLFIEVVDNLRYTNCRAAIQLKATDSEEICQDGFVAVQVRTSNLNYLHNAPAPLYILYIVPRNEFRFFWEREERQRLDKNNPGWTEQKYTTVRFFQILNADTLCKIRDRIIRESQLNCKIHELLGHSSYREEVTFSIDVKTLAISTPEEFFGFLDTGGISMVSAGHSKIVLEKISQLPPELIHKSRVLLVKAYAEHSCSRYMASKASLAEIELREDSLSEEDREFANFLSYSCSFHLGEIEHTEILKHIEEAGNPKGQYALLKELDFKYYSYLREYDVALRQENLRSLRDFTKKILSSDEVGGRVKMHTCLYQLYADGADSLQDLFNDTYRLGMRRNLGLLTQQDISSVVQRNVADFAEWERKIKLLLDNGQSSCNDLWMADVISTRSKVRTQNIVARLNFCHYFKIPAPDIHEHFEVLEEELNQIIQVYVAYGMLQGELRARLLLADVLEIAGNSTLSSAIARDVHPKAKAFGFRDLAEWALNHISGKTPLKQFEFSLRKIQNEDIDVLIADESDDGLELMIQEVMKAQGSPARHYDGIKKEIFASRDIANDRFEWCQYIELMKDRDYDLDDILSQNWLCGCNKYRFKSRIGFLDWHNAMHGFKKVFCEKCHSKIPKVK